MASPPPEYPLPSCLSWTYEHVVSGVWDGWLPISLYPYALIEDGKGYSGGGLVGRCAPQPAHHRRQRGGQPAP